jgi:excisionase family DNA binding protein
MTNAKDNPAGDAAELWDANDAARYLKVSRSWVYQRAEAGLLPCLRVGGLLRFDPAMVRAFARGEVQPSKVVPFSVSPSGKNG